jgi:WS/DGAT/MGAT family acyltransferase
MGALLDTEPNPPEALEATSWSPPPSLPGPAETLVDAAFDQLLALTSTAEGIVLGLMDPRSTAGNVASVARSLGAGLPHMFRIGRMPWATSLQAPSGLAWHRIPFDQVQQVRHKLRGTVNDVVLTVLSGALRRYLAFHGHRIEGEEVRVLIPVNVRTKDEQRDLGNRVSFMLAGLPVGLGDPKARFKAIHAEIASLKEIDQAGNLDRLAGLIGRTPPALQHQLGAGLRMPNFIYDFVCTNVPGPASPLYCLGHRMVEHYPWVPIGWRMGLGVAVMSYNGELCFALTADRGVLHDLDRLGEYVGEAFAELLAAAGADERHNEPGLPTVLSAGENGAKTAGGQARRQRAPQEPR